MPAISVIIPVYNGEKYIGEAIDSLLNQELNHKYTIEIIVVDDGSTDRTPIILENYRDQIKIFKQHNRMSAHARNYGLLHSTGDFIAYLDGDDIAHPDRLQKQLDALVDNPDCAMVCSAINYIDDQGNNMGGRKVNKVDLIDLCFSNPVPMSTIMHRRNTLKTIGNFDPDSLAWDWDLVVRFAAHSHFIILDEALVSYRLHSQNTSKSRKRHYHYHRRSRYYIVNKISKELPEKSVLRLIALMALIEYYFIGCLFLPNVLERVWYKAHTAIPKFTKQVYRLFN